METITVKLILYHEESDSRSLIHITIAKHKTIGELSDFIKSKLRQQYLEGDVYFVFNEFDIEMNEDYLLGGPIFPNDAILSQSIIEDNSILYAHCNEIEPDDDDEDESDLVQPLQTIFQSTLLFGPNASSNVSTSVSINGSSASASASASSSNSNHEQLLDYLTNRLNSSLNSINTLSGLTQLLSQSNLNSQLDILINGLNRNNISTTGSISGLGITSGGQSGPNINSNLFTSYNSGNTLNPFNSMFSMLNALGNMNIQRNMDDIVVGLHKDDLEALRVNLHKNFENKDSCDTCPVCIDKFKDEDLCRELKCHHLFHKDCVDHWLESNIKCPVCRMETGRGVPKL